MHLLLATPTLPLRADRQALVTSLLRWKPVAPWPRSLVALQGGDTLGGGAEAASLHRPLREDPPDAEWQTAQEEEDNSEKEDPEPLLQRIFQL